MVGISSSILDRANIKVSIEGSKDGKILGYYLDSRFFPRNERDLFISELEERLDDKEFKDTLLIVDTKEKEIKEMFKEYRSSL